MVLAAWLFVGLITMFGLSRLFAFGSGADAHLASPRTSAGKRGATAAAGRRRPRASWSVLRAAAPGIIAGLFLLLLVETAMWPEQQSADLQARLVDPTPSGVMLPEVERSAAATRSSRRRSNSEVNGASRSRRLSSPTVRPEPAVAAASPVTFAPSAPGGSPVLTDPPPESRPGRRPRDPRAPQPGAAPGVETTPVSVPAPPATGSAPTPTPAPASSPAPVAVAAGPPPAAPSATAAPAAPAEEETKKRGKNPHGGPPAHAGPPPHAKAKGRDKGKRGKGPGGPG